MSTLSGDTVAAPHSRRGIYNSILKVVERVSALRTWVCAHFFMTKRWSSLLRVIFCSMMEKRRPMQIRGPAPKGNHAIGWRWTSSSNLNIIDLVMQSIELFITVLDGTRQRLHPKWSCRDESTIRRRRRLDLAVSPFCACRRPPSVTYTCALGR